MVIELDNGVVPSVAPNWIQDSPVVLIPTGSFQAGSSRVCTLKEIEYGAPSWSLMVYDDAGLAMVGVMVAGIAVQVSPASSDRTSATGSGLTTLPFTPYTVVRMIGSTPVIE